ncbi:MAG: HAMP domain-containing histidine kinase [Desulfobacterales bacterium]|nr:HAMP domain-containing histidine kinase [Desulfobacterales bacterium]
MRKKSEHKNTAKSHQIGIQTKISLILVLVTTAIFSISTFYDYTASKTEMTRDLEELADFIIIQQAKNLALPIWNFADELVEEVMNSTMNEKRVYAFIIMNDKDMINGKKRDNDWNVVEAEDEISGNYLVKTRAIVKDASTLGNVKIFFTYKFMNEKLRRTIINEILTTIILDIALIMVLFLSIRKSVTLPLGSVTENFRVIASGDFSKSIRSDRKDEIGQLVSDAEIMRVSIKDLTENLEAKVQDRTKQLQESLENLKKAQDQLVQSEKMAALGGLVAGVAHEINTPVGLGVTEASFLQEKTRIFSEAYTSGDLKRSDFEKYIRNATGAADSILSNLERAAELITSFKQVAVDQSSEEQRRFVLKTYISEILLSLRSKYKKTSHTITVNCPEDLEIDSYPGAFSQVITNFVTNSLLHGFEGIEKGEIVFDVSTEGDELLFSYSDNGRGMDDESLRQVFEPFFTTKRTRGGTGLGMHIVYNLVTQTLGGRLECKSAPGEGTVFLIKMKITDQDPGVMKLDI